MTVRDGRCRTSIVLRAGITSPAEPEGDRPHDCTCRAAPALNRSVGCCPAGRQAGRRRRHARVGVPCVGSPRPAACWTGLAGPRSRLGQCRSAAWPARDSWRARVAAGGQSGAKAVTGTRQIRLQILRAGLLCGGRRVQPRRPRPEHLRPVVGLGRSERKPAGRSIARGRRLFAVRQVEHWLFHVAGPERAMAMLVRYVPGSFRFGRVSMRQWSC